MSGFERPNTDAPVVRTGSDMLLPMDELGRARYRRHVAAWTREARSRARVLREQGRMAATLLRAHGFPPHQSLDEPDQQSAGVAWLAVRFEAETDIHRGSDYWLFAGRIAAEQVKGLVRLDDPPSGSSVIPALAAVDTYVTFDEEYADNYWKPDGSPAGEPAGMGPTSIRNIAAIRTGIENLIREAGIV